jgi:hypothetical protein
MITITGDVDRLIRQLDDVQARQIPYALSRALNDTARQVIEAEKVHMTSVFDRPTRWTLNAFRVEYSTKSHLVATVLRKTAAERRFYLEVQASGGARGRTGMESALIPRMKYAGQIVAITPASGMKMTPTGSMSQAALTRIVSSLGGPQGGSRVRQRGRSKAAYFVPKPGSKLSPGVWQRTGRNQLRKVLNFTTAPPRYTPRFRFEEVAEMKARETFEANFHRWLQQALATAK